MESEKYIIFNYNDLTDASKENLSKAPNNEVTFIELKEGKTGYYFNKRPF
jgi:hypothetical protein